MLEFEIILGLRLYGQNDFHCPHQVTQKIYIITFEFIILNYQYYYLD